VALTNKLTLQHCRWQYCILMLIATHQRP